MRLCWADSFPGVHAGRSDVNPDAEGLHLAGFELPCGSLAFQQDCDFTREHPVILDLDETCLFAASLGSIKSNYDAHARE